MSITLRLSGPVQILYLQSGPVCSVQFEKYTQPQIANIYSTYYIFNYNIALYMYTYYVLHT